MGGFFTFLTPASSPETSFFTVHGAESTHDSTVHLQPLYHGVISWFTIEKYEEILWFSSYAALTGEKKAAFTKKNAINVNRGQRNDWNITRRKFHCSKK